MMSEKCAVQHLSYEFRMGYVDGGSGGTLPAIKHRGSALMGPVQAQAEPNRDAGGEVVPSRPTLAKITMPSVTQSLPREALFSRLDEQSNRLIWLTAPAGYGKTTSVSTYLRARGRPAVWYQCDDGDADIASFFHYLSLTLEPSAGGRLSLPSFRPEYLDAVAAFTRNYFRAWFASLEVGTTVVLDD